MSILPCDQYSFETANTETCYRLVSNQLKPMAHTFKSIMTGVMPIPQGGFCPTGTTCCRYNKEAFMKENQTTCYNDPSTACTTDADCDSSDYCNTCNKGKCQINTNQSRSCYSTSDCNGKGWDVQCTTETAGYTLNGNKQTQRNPWLSGYKCNVPINPKVASCTFSWSLPSCESKGYSGYNTKDTSDGCAPTFFNRYCEKPSTVYKDIDACYNNTPANQYAQWDGFQCYQFKTCSSVVSDDKYMLSYKQP